MADVEETRFNSLAERIAALNKKKNLDVSGPQTTPHTVPGKRPPPPPPSTLARRPAPPTETNSVPPPPPRRTSTLPGRPPPSPAAIGSSDLLTPKPPPLPTRRPSTQQLAPSPRQPSTSPALPPRRPSSHSIAADDDKALTRRNSASSGMSELSVVSSSLTIASAASSTSTGQAPRKLPPAAIPPPPPTRRDREAAEKQDAARTSRVKSPLVTSKSSPAVPQSEAARRPSLSPLLPSRPAARSPVPKPSEYRRSSRSSAGATTAGATPDLSTTRKLPPLPPVWTKSPRADDSLRPGRADSPPPPLPATRSDSERFPPPVPLASRPSDAEIRAVTARLAVQHACLTCRDFSAPDAVAAQYPRHALSSPHGQVAFLAGALCDPFPSATDKARAIFAWCHHNIDYDVDAFFNGTIRARSPDETIARGLAVCSGYADAYKAIAQRAGLECVVVSGHGKGYGHKPLRHGDPIPPYKPDGHAWNAVRIDGGEWKLVDACWGAGNVDGATRRFTRQFKPHEFTAPNAAFGLAHFPKSEEHFFLRGGRIPTWDEYMLGPAGGAEPVTVFSAAAVEGVSSASFMPRQAEIPTRHGSGGNNVHFQFSMQCEHWAAERNGKGRPALFLLRVNRRGGARGKPENLVMLSDGFRHWADVPASDLGVPGEEVSVISLTSLDNADARGVTAEEYLAKQGRCSASWELVARWRLV